MDNELNESIYFLHPRERSNNKNNKINEKATTTIAMKIIFFICISMI